VESPKPPWYRRFEVVVLAVNLVVAAALVAAMVALWPRAAAQRPGAPATTAGVVGRQAGQLLPKDPEPAAILPTSTKTHLEPGVLWQRRGSAGSGGGRFVAPGRWRVVWSFNCQSFARYGGGNFKLYGAGAFAGVSVQRVGVRGRGVLRVSGGGRGRLTIESVCDRWTVTAVAPKTCCRASGQLAMPHLQSLGVGSTGERRLERQAVILTTAAASWPRDAAIATFWSAPRSGRPRPAVRSRGHPGRAALGAGKRTRPRCGRRRSGGG
jgi:hypothetical protein